MIKFKKLIEMAKLPEYKSEMASGADLYSAENTYIDPGEVKLITTGLLVASNPNSLEMEIRSRSSLALKGIIIANSPGTIDADYRGEIKIILMNLTKGIFYIVPGDRIAQLLIVDRLKVKFDFTEEIDKTERGSGGFGSTGK